MSLLPPAMKITDAIPMTLGAAVKRALNKAKPVDRITAFNVGDHMPDGEVRPPRQRKELTPAELGHIGECCTEAIQADEPTKFKAGDRVRVLCDKGHPTATVLRQVGANSMFAGEWVILHGSGNEGIAPASALELIPSPKQEGGWVDWKGGECPIPGVHNFEVRWRDSADEERYHELSPDYWRRTHEGEEDPIIAYRLLP